MRTKGPGCTPPTAEVFLLHAKAPPGSPMTLGNMRELGVQNLIAFCLDDSCRHQALIDVSGYPAETEGRVPVPGEVRQVRRPGQLRLRRPPQVQAVGMVIDVLGIGRVKLRYALVIIPEQGFDVTHLIPGRGAFAQRSVFLAARDNRDMFPARPRGGITSNDLEHRRGLREGDGKQAAAGFRRSAIFIACEPPLLN